MANYSARFKRTASTTLSVGGVRADATTPRRIGVYRAIFGSEASPADAALNWELHRFTAAGTSTAVTPQDLSGLGAASLAKAGENHTVDPTKTANAILLSVPVHQRATWQFYAGPDSERLWIPATANNGLAVTTPVATATPVVTATVHFAE